MYEAILKQRLSRKYEIYLCKKIFMYCNFLFDFTIVCARIELDGDFYLDMSFCYRYLLGNKNVWVFPLAVYILLVPM